jgi:hypothetical protein
MTRYNKEYNINTDPDRIWNAIASYMDDEAREEAHADMTRGDNTCTNEEFLARYLELDPDFEDLLRVEFDIIL